jgi:phosphoribosylformylglycinamidine synthase subunit PurQ / glutaminase
MMRSCHRTNIKYMKFGVVSFPGSTCDEDMIYVLENLMEQKVERLWHKDADLKNSDFIIIPGGPPFINPTESLNKVIHTPIIQEINEHADKGGFVFGIGNGFQILLEAGLLEGTLLLNENQQFVCKNTFIKPGNVSTVLTKGLEDNSCLMVPVAHRVGKFSAEKETLKKLIDQDQILFRFCNEDGEVFLEDNPNGSIENIAGICNVQKNIFGMTPHPERAASHILGNEDGRLIFESLLKYC